MLRHVLKASIGAAVSLVSARALAAPPSAVSVPSEEVAKLLDADTEWGPVNVVAGNAGGGFSALFAFDELSERYTALHGGVWVRASITAFVGPINVRGEAGIGVHPAFDCADEGEEGCGIYGEFFGTALAGPAIAIDDRVRLFARAGVSGGFLGGRPHSIAYGELPRTELGFAAWNPALPFWRELGWKGWGVSLIDAALSLSYFAQSSVGQSPDKTGDGLAVGVSTIAVLGPLSLEARLDTLPGSTPLAMGTTRLCAGVFAMVCLGAETITSWTRDNNDGAIETKSGQTVLLTLGAGGALGIEWW